MGYVLNFIIMDKNNHLPTVYTLITIVYRSEFNLKLRSLHKSHYIIK